VAPERSQPCRLRRHRGDVPQRTPKETQLSGPRWWGSLAPPGSMFAICYIGCATAAKAFNHAVTGSIGS
jgi:hypothetical protein